MNTQSSPYVCQAEVLYTEVHPDFRLIFVTHERKPYVVLHWLGFSLEIPAHMVESFARDWAKQFQGQPSPVVDLWVAGFDAAPVPCLPRADLATFLAYGMADHPHVAALLAALEPIDVGHA